MQQTQFEMQLAQFQVQSRVQYPYQPQAEPQVAIQIQIPIPPQVPMQGAMPKKKHPSQTQSQAFEKKPMRVKGFALMERSNGRQIVQAELFESSAFAHRVANAMGVASFRQACAAIGTKVFADGTQRVPQLTGERLSVFGKTVISKNGEEWLALLFVEDRRVLKKLCIMTPADIFEGVVNTFLYGMNHALSSSKLKILDILLVRVGMLLEGGLNVIPAQKQRLEDHRDRVQHLLTRQKSLAKFRKASNLKMRKDKKSMNKKKVTQQQPSLPAEAQPPVGAKVKAAQSTNNVSSMHLTISTEESKVAAGSGGSPPAERGSLRLPFGRASFEEQQFLADHSWRIAGASIWQIPRGGQAKLRVELFKSRAFAIEVMEQSNTPSFRQFCHDAAVNFAYHGNVAVNCRKDWMYQVYARSVPRSCGPDLVCLTVFDACDAPCARIMDSFDRLSPSHYIALMASAFAQHSDHRMSKKLSNVRNALRLLDELDDGEEAAKSPFVKKVKEKVERLLAVSHERKRARSRQLPQTPSTRASTPSAASTTPPTDSVEEPYPTNPRAETLISSVSAQKAVPPAVSATTTTPAETAQAQLMKYLMESNRHLSAQNMLLMDRIDKLTGQLEKYKGIYDNIQRKNVTQTGLNPAADIFRC